MSQRYIGNYSDYVSNLGSSRCCYVSPKDVPVVGPTGPRGAQGFVGNTYTGATGPSGPTGMGCRGPTGPPGGMSNINQTITPLTDASGCIIVNASNYFSTSWSYQTGSTTLELSFQNLIVNGLYRLYLTNTSVLPLTITSDCSTIYSNVSSITSAGVYIIDVKYVGSNVYYLTITGPYA